MMSDPVVQPYAAALFQRAEAEGKLEEMQREVSLLLEAIQESSSLQTLIKLPTINRATKGKIFAHLCPRSSFPQLYPFLQTVIKRERTAWLREILEEVTRCYKQKKKIDAVELQLAAPISEELKQRIVEALKTRLNAKEIELELKIDPELLGGYKVRVGSTQIDCSIAQQLQELQHHFNLSHHFKS